MACGFGGYANPNIPCSPRVNNPPLWVPNPQHYVPPLPPPQDQDSGAESSSSDSSDSEGNASLDAQPGTP